MTPFLQLVFVLLVIILSAKIASYLSIRLGQPSVLGELLVGVVLGPTLLDLTHLPFISDTHLHEVIIEVGELGVLLLMFVAGLELNLADLARNKRVSALAGILGVLAPVGLGWGTGLLFGFDGYAALFLGLILGATSVSISAQTLMELRVLRTRVGLGLLGAAVFDDVLVILLLSTVLAVASGAGGLGSVAIIFIRILVFMLLSVVFGLKVLPWLVRRSARLEVSQAALSLALVVMFVYALAAELVGGMAAITGTFLAGLMFARLPEKERLERSIHTVSYGVFVPIFFVSIGLGINLREVGLNALWLMLAISVVGILGKLLGAGLGAKLGGFTTRESIQLGAGMISRGEVGLIVAAIAVQEGFVRPGELPAMVGMVILTTLITPPLLRALFSNPQAAEHRQVAVTLADIKES